MAQLKQDKDRNVREMAGNGDQEPATQLISNEIANDQSFLFCEQT